MKNKFIYIIAFVLIILLSILIGYGSHSYKNMTRNYFYQYEFATIIIEKPALVEITTKDGIESYVCSDSAIYTCYLYNWRGREDVFPLSMLYGNKEYDIVRYLTSDNKWVSKYKYDQFVYPQYFISQKYNDTINIGSFYFEQNVFILNYEPISIEPIYEEICYNKDSTESDCTLISGYKPSVSYHLTVRPKYSFLQVMYLRYKQHKIYKMMNE